jgi:hypothetical protein
MDQDRRPDHRPNLPILLTHLRTGTLARDFPGQVSAPPKKPRKDASPQDIARWEQRRHQQSSQRICIEHAIAEPKQWRSLQRWTGRREYFEETALAIAGLVSDRAAAR